jgi:Asp-tRNA(Asn)/Glu-tRNA(Gln) amidotransferase C subunit
MKKDEILKQAKLCRILLLEDEEKKYTPQIKKVLEWEHQIKDIEISNYDIPQQYLSTFNDGKTIENHSIIYHNQSEHNYFVVPKVLD